MLHPVFPHTEEGVKLMAEYLQSQILASGGYQYAYNDIFIPVIFLAGAPGAGKTEWIESFPDIEHYVILDTDLYRSLFEGYTGTNASDFHQYASRVMDRMYSFCIKHGYNMIVDGTFANIQKATENIRQCEKKVNTILCSTRHTGSSHLLSLYKKERARKAEKCSDRGIRP